MYGKKNTFSQVQLTHGVSDEDLYQENHYSSTILRKVTEIKWLREGEKKTFITLSYKQGGGAYYFRNFEGAT